MGETAVKVDVKWGKKVLKDVEIDTSEPPTVFKMQLWTLTGVSPERQTILFVKGGKLKDDNEWGKIAPKAGMSVMLMGTPDEASLAPPPANAVKVRDDLDAAVSDAMDYEPPPMHPPGLDNLGNTCYMNSTVQCLTAVPELRNALGDFDGNTAAMNPSEKLTAGLRDLSRRLGTKGPVASVNPATFLTILRSVNPQFGERNDQGMYMQQDAEECWGEILARLSQALAVRPASASTDAAEGSSQATNHVDRIFSMTMKVQDTCEEDDSDEVVDRSEEVRTLKCHISSSVNHLVNGISEGLEEKIEKFSEKLDRSAVWKRTSRIDRIPPYLIVQFVRFFWKPQERVKAKILRNVSFPLVLDVYDFCTDELKSKLDGKREEARVAEDERIAAIAGSAGDEKKDAEESEDKPDAEINLTAETGNYELYAVLTHKGRAADSGHYVAWVKDKGSMWYKYDDESVSVHTEEEVKKLSGGGDWHMAYMCLYRAKN